MTTTRMLTIVEGVIVGTYAGWVMGIVSDHTLVSIQPAIPWILLLGILTLYFVRSVGEDLSNEN